MNLLFSLPRNLKSDVMKTARNSTIVDILGEMKLDGGHVKLLSFHLHCLDIFQPCIHPLPGILLEITSYMPHVWVETNVNSFLASSHTLD